jgi:hypothetical protein
MVKATINLIGGTLDAYIESHGKLGVQLYAHDVAALAVALGRERQWAAGKTAGSQALTRQDVFEAIMFTRPLSQRKERIRHVD